MPTALRVKTPPGGPIPAMRQGRAPSEPIFKAIPEAARRRSASGSVVHSPDLPVVQMGGAASVPAQARPMAPPSPRIPALFAGGLSVFTDADRHPWADLPVEEAVLPEARPGPPPAKGAGAPDVYLEAPPVSLLRPQNAVPIPPEGSPGAPDVVQISLDSRRYVLAGDTGMFLDVQSLDPEGEALREKAPPEWIPFLPPVGQIRGFHDLITAYVTRMGAALRHVDDWPAAVGLGTADPRTMVKGISLALQVMGHDPSRWHLAECYTILLSIPPEQTFEAVLSDEVVTQVLGASTARWVPAPVLAPAFPAGWLGGTRRPTPLLFASLSSSRWAGRDPRSSNRRPSSSRTARACCIRARRRT